jgi:hypothetical protein
LTIACWSVDKYSTDSLLGQIVIPLTSLVPNVASKLWYPLAARGDEKVKGKIFLEALMITDTVRRLSFRSELNAPLLIMPFRITIRKNAQSVLSKKKSGKKVKSKLSLGEDSKAGSKPNADVRLL